MADGQGVRQRKRLHTRESLIRVSQELFHEKGYDGTTLEEICGAVLISVPTFFSYFRSKDALALAWDWDWFEHLRETLADPDRDRPTLVLWREHVERGARAAMRHRDVHLRSRRMQQSSVVLVRARLDLLQHYNDALRDALAVDLGTNRDVDVRTDLIATLLTYGNNNAINWWIARDGEADLLERALAVVDVTIDRFGESEPSRRSGRSRSNDHRE